MAIQEQYILSKESNGDVKLTQNSVVVFQSINASALVNTLVLKEGNVGIGTNAPGGKLEILNSLTGHGLYIHQAGVLVGGQNGLYVYSGAIQVNAHLFRVINTNPSTTYDSILFDNDGTGTNLHIQQDGVLASSKYSLYIYSNAVQVNSPLVYFKQDNASSTSRVLEIDNDGTGIACYIHQDNISSTNPVLEIDNSGIGHGCYIHQYSVLASGKSALYITGVAQTTNSLVTIYQVASSTRTALEIINSGTGAGIDINQLGNGTALELNNDGTAHGLYLHQDGVLASSKYSLYIYSNAVQVNSPLVYIHLDNINSTSTLIYFRNDGIGHGQYIQQIGNLATGKYALYIDNDGTPVDGAGRAIRLDGCTIIGTGEILGYIAVNIDGTQRAVPYYAIA